MDSKVKATIYLVLWILLIVPTFLAVITLAYSLAAPEVVGYGVWPIFVVCTGGTAVPLALFLVLWWKHHTRYQVLSDVAATLRIYFEIPIQDLARRFRKTDTEMEALIAAAVAEGYASGRIDAATHRFVNLTPASPSPLSRSASSPTPAVATALPATPSAAPPAGDTPPARFCRECGNRVYPVTGTDDWRCWSCGNVQKTRG